MTGALIGKLKVPASRYRIDDPDSPFYLQDFETLAFAKEEDEKRIRGLRQAIAMRNPLLDSKRARWLIGELEIAIDGGEVSQNLACFTHFRDQRIRLTGAILEVLSGKKDGIATFTLIPRAWKFKPDELVELEPRTLLNQLRTQLRRAGSAHATGFSFAALHGEWEPNAGVFVVHVHGLCTDGMVDVINRLRGTQPYKRHESVFRPVHLKRLKLETSASNEALAKATSYLVKAFWPQRPIGPFGPQGEIKRVRSVRRIKEPIHSILKCWLSSFDISDIVLFTRLHIRGQTLVTR